MNISAGALSEPNEYGFDEEEYLNQHPEVADAITKGFLPNAEFHYRLFGPQRRNERFDAATAVPQSDATGDAGAPTDAIQPAIRANIDGVVVASSGTIFLIGWSDDRSDPIARLRLVFAGGCQIEIEGTAIGRLRRQDVETALGTEGSHHFGFCAVCYAQTAGGIAAGGTCTIDLRLASGRAAQFATIPRQIDDVGMRDLMLGYVAGLEFHGNKTVESFYFFDRDLGDALIRHNRDITLAIVSASAVERFTTNSKAPKGSIIVCLYGRPEYQFLQNALFSACRNADDYEYIYVSNSPELIEILCKTAAISKRIYGLNVSIVMLPSNAGFGAANNVAVEYARSDRLLIVNPDIFPMDPGWAVSHAKILAALPSEQTRLFGARLFYADGSLMHAGMYFDVDWGVSVSGLEVRRRPMLRIEHRGKGAPKDVREFLGSRPVPAVSGAFISMERQWFERLDGFAEDYVFGHYEDADLCLRSLDKGVVPWVHDLAFWHLEGRGSTRLPHHEGASMLNRWLFTRMWHERVRRELLGDSPTLASPGRKTALCEEGNNQMAKNDDP